MNYYTFLKIYNSSCFNFNDVGSLQEFSLKSKNMISEFMEIQNISLNRGAPQDYPIILMGDLFELLIFHLLIQKGYVVQKPAKDIGIDFIAVKDQIHYAIQVKFRSNSEYVFQETEFTTFKAAFKKYKRTLSNGANDHARMLVITNVNKVDIADIHWIPNKRLEQELIPIWASFTEFINSFKK